MERRNETADALRRPAAALYRSDFHLVSGSTPQINRSDLLLWRITLYGVIFVQAGVCMTDFHRIALLFIVLIALNEIVPEVFR
nr:hypothetical protein [Enterobacter bugandensis]